MIILLKYTPFLVICITNEGAPRSHHQPTARAHSRRSSYVTNSSTIFRAHCSGIANESSRIKEGPVGAKALPKTPRVDSQIRRISHLSFVLNYTSCHYSSFSTHHTHRNRRFACRSPLLKTTLVCIIFTVSHIRHILSAHMHPRVVCRFIHEK
jgi:hypothetical protein